MRQLIYLSFFLVVFSLISGCGKSESQKKLERKEKDLQAKEDQLRSFAEQLKLREENLDKRTSQLDSIENKSDTLGVYNPKLVGNWKVSMQCIETTCEGYVVGDSKAEQWEITYQNNKVIVQAVSNMKMLRIYSGLYKEEGFQLIENARAGNDTGISIALNLRFTNDNLMEGHRVIDMQNKCRVVFTVDATRQ